MTGPATRVKICGLRDEETVLAMDGLAFHEIGFIFAPSKRRIGTNEARACVRAAHGIRTVWDVRPQTVGVFVNAPMEELSAVLNAVPLDVVQLHGNERPERCAELKRRYPSLRVWKAFSVSSENGESAEAARAYADIADALLLDAPGGGTGKTFDWSAIDRYRSIAAEAGKPLYVAGGLNADNIGELLSVYRPDGVDVSSGVETDGVKDIGKIKTFVRRVLEA